MRKTVGFICHQFALASGGLTVLCGSALADPLSLTVSQSVTYDSNFSKNAASDSETISQTNLQLKLDKSFGRQTYQAAARYGLARYAHFGEQLNGSNYDISGAFSSGIASNWQVDVNGNASEYLNPNQDNPTAQRVVKNNVSDRNVGLNLRYGVAGRLYALVNVGAGKLDYSLSTQAYKNRDQRSMGMRVVYATTDMLNFGVGVSKAVSDYPDYIIGGESERVDQRSLDLSANWQVTGFSSFAGVLSLTRNSYRSDADAKFNGLTGRLNWNFTPRGHMRYTVQVARTTDSDSTQTSTRVYQIGGLLDTALNTVTTSVYGSARWEPTAKLGLSLAAGWYQYDVKRTQSGVLAGDVDGPTQSHYINLRLSGDYQYSRALAFGCSAEQYKQTADISPRIAYDGHQFSCNASFTID